MVCEFLKQCMFYGGWRSRSSWQRREKSGQWFDQIHRVYVLMILVFLIKFSGWKPNFNSVFLLVCSILVPLAYFTLVPFPFWDIIVRVVCLGFVGASFYCGVGDSD